MPFDQAEHVDCFVCQWCRSLHKEQTWHWWVNLQAYEAWLWVDLWGMLFWISWHQVCSQPKDWRNCCNAAGTHQENSISNSNGRLQPKLGSCLSHHTLELILIVNPWMRSGVTHQSLACFSTCRWTLTLTLHSQWAKSQGSTTLPRRVMHLLSRWSSVTSSAQLTREPSFIPLALYSLIVGWVDAAFGNLYCIDPDHEPSATKSRTRYIITLGGCPLVWKSQLHLTIVLSAQEGEYCTLSQAMHTLIPIHAILIEISSVLSLPPATTASIHSWVFEDNNSTLLLAINQCSTSCTKHYLIQWHFFWSHVKDGDIEVLHVDTDLQDADYMTKGLPHQPFESNCFRTQGWYSLTIFNNLH